MENKIEMEDAILKDQNNLSTPKASIYETMKTKEDLRNVCVLQLREMMKYRKISSGKLARETGISLRTIQNYMSGSTSLYDASAVKVLKIAYVLRCDPEILVGLEDVEVFYRKQYIRERDRREEMRKMKYTGKEFTKDAKKLDDKILQEQQTIPVGYPFSWYDHILNNDE